MKNGQANRKRKVLPTKSVAAKKKLILDSSSSTEEEEENIFFADSSEDDMSTLAEKLDMQEREENSVNNSDGTVSKRTFAEILWVLEGEEFEVR